MRDNAFMRNERLKRILLVLLVIVNVGVIGCRAYIGDYYHADAAALSAAEQGESANGVTVSQTNANVMVFEPAGGESTVGVAFYPGAKVEWTAYAPLMQQLAERGITAMLLKMPYNLAIVDADAANLAYDAAPNVQNWYVCGHSMGGIAAGMYASGNADSLAGIIFLASYTTDDLSQSGLAGLSIYGSEDGVINRTAMEDNARNLPAGTQTYAIEGGNHGHFGSYGEQANDGVATITPEQQQSETADIITAFVLGA